MRRLCSMTLARHLLQMRTGALRKVLTRGCTLWLRSAHSTSQQPSRSEPNTKPNLPAGLSKESVLVNPAPASGRRLVLCFDGTNESFDDDPTNVARLVSLLKKDDYRSQMVYYQTGIGTYINQGRRTFLRERIVKLLASAFAGNIAHHIMEGYYFLMQNWAPEDTVCLLGFSRGAYTARALAGMLHKVGLLPRGNKEHVPFAFEMYKRTDKAGWEMSQAFKASFCHNVAVDFVGVWDTVSSVGLLSNKIYPFTASDHHIGVFRHAISLDERRCRFQANYWHKSPGPSEGDSAALVYLETLERDPPSAISVSIATSSKAASAAVPSQSVRQQNSTVPANPTDVEEVWFSGNHSDVGGGNELYRSTCAAARIPLIWMMREMVLTGTGVVFDEEALAKEGIAMPTPTKDEACRHEQSEAERVQQRRENDISILDQRYEEDVRAPLHDELRSYELWWLLELLPLFHQWKLENGRWRKLMFAGPNCGRARSMPPWRIKVHVSVKHRMQTDSMYKPAASLVEEPNWVE